MREVEILVEVHDPLETAKRALTPFDYKGAQSTLDIYFFDPKRENLKLNTDNKLMECCRIREKNGKAFLTYKKDVYENGVWQYSDEYETNVENLSTIQKILTSLGLQELVRIDNTKHTYVTPKYEIVLEEVKDLGLFLEVEAFDDDPKKSVTGIKKEIDLFIQSLGLKIGEELNSGKPELLLRKKQK